MSLPDLALQIVYGRLAWALVAAAMLLAILPVLKPALLSTWLSKLSPKQSPVDDLQGQIRQAHNRSFPGWIFRRWCAIARR